MKGTCRKRTGAVLTSEMLRDPFLMWRTHLFCITTSQAPLCFAACLPCIRNWGKHCVGWTLLFRTHAICLVLHFILIHRKGGDIHPNQECLAGNSNINRSLRIGAGIYGGYKYEPLGKEWQDGQAYASAFFFADSVASGFCHSKIHVVYPLKFILESYDHSL